jgi:hypothetical protein
MRDIIEGAGSGFAFPSQTTYFSRDSGLDAGRASEVETEVEQWRSEGSLPFPEFGTETRGRLENTLDYPPRGSPGYRQPEVSGPQRPPRGPATLHGKDFVDVSSLAARLQEPNQISDYVWGRLSVRTQHLLKEYRGEVDAEVREALAQDLNAVLQGPSIYAVDRFSGVKRRQASDEMLAADLAGDDLAWLNRLLLEDAFPNELSRKHD